MKLEEIRQEAKNYFMSLQDQICASFEDVHGGSFKEDLWDREQGGGGRTRIFSEGKLFEKAGVNFSEVHGSLDPKFAESMPLGNGTEFYATGISLVMHPVNPFVPTTHANFRYIQRGDVGWFGGGADLTPYYPDREDVVHFHRTYKDVLDKFDPALYPEFKKKCDEYFFLPHRNEMRGVGGIFFDYQIASTDKLKMLKSLGDSFVSSYLPIAEKQVDKAFTSEQKKFQEVRRGRYVEFNLLYDRGTIFGLKTGGRIESILMSLPLKVRWEYSHEIASGSPEADLLPYLQAQDWC